jgi:Cu/Ag efflux protein CusF
MTFANVFLAFRSMAVALSVAATILAATLPAAAQSTAGPSTEVRGVVQRVDPAAGIVYLTDGRTIRIEPGSKLTVDGRLITLADVQPGWTLVVPGAVSAPSSVVVATPPASPSRPPRAPIDATGVVSRVDPQTGTIYLQDGRVLQATGRTTIWQPVGVGELKPGASVYMRNADPVDFRPAGAPPVGSARFQEGTKP